MSPFKFFKKDDKEPENVEEILAQFGELKKKFEKVSAELEKAKKENKFNVQKIGLIRFNPFKEIGSDQSFVLAILDGNDNGVVITSHYTKEGSRLYGKPVKNSGSDYLLSDEEKQAIEKAKSVEKKAA